MQSRFSSISQREREFQTLEEMTDLAEKYLEAHGGKLSDKRKTSSVTGEKIKKSESDQKGQERKDDRKCFRCDRIGHLAKDCRAVFTKDGHRLEKNLSQGKKTIKEIGYVMTAVKKVT